MNSDDTRFPPPQKNRILVLDQLRGYAIFGMILVNYLGCFKVMPEAFKHHRAFQDYWPFGFSYADHIAPLFMFVVGMGFRLSLPRRAEKIGLGKARVHAFKRYSILILVGAVFCGLEPRYIWDALVDIGCAGLLALLVIHASVWIRIGFAVGYLVLYEIFCALPVFPSPDGVEGPWNYYQWTMKYSIDGGPLGPLSWVFMLLLGTVAYDLIATRDHRKILIQSLLWGVGLFLTGWLLRLEWPGIKDPWYFTQRGMHASYSVASTGICFLTLFIFYLLNEVAKIKLPMLNIMGKNALTIYLVQYSLLEMYDSFVFFPENSSVWWALVGMALFMAFNYGVALRLHKDNVIIRL